MNSLTQSRSMDESVPPMIEALPPVVLSPENCSFIRSCIDTLVALMRLFEFDSDGFKVQSSYDHWIAEASIVGDPVKYVKYKCAAFYAVHVSTGTDKQEVPSLPGIDDQGADKLLGGRAYRWIRALKHRNPLRFRIFNLSVLMSKKGMPRPSKEYISLVVQKAVRKLTKVPPSVSFLDWNVGKTSQHKVSFIVSQYSAKMELERTVDELFAGQSFSRLDRIAPFFPSTKSNFSTKQKSGGTVATILHHPNILTGLKTDQPLMSLIRITGSGQPEEEVKDLTLFFRDPRNHPSHFILDTSELDNRFETMYKRILHEAMNEMPFVMPIGLAEPLKVRVITKGPPLTYTALKPLQRKLWGVLKRHPTFALIGKTVDEKFIQERLGAVLNKEGTLPHAMKKFLSVDYADATNEMYSWVSEVVIERISICLQLTDDERTLAIRALTGHLIYDEEKDLSALPMTDVESIVLEYTDCPEIQQFLKSFSYQTMGQLMGSILSFPILCIANAAVCRWSIEIGTRANYLLRDCPLMINGDDALLKSNTLTKRAWNVTSSTIGLSPSVGKVYFSDQFMNINSTTYYYHPNGFSVYSDYKGLNDMGEEVTVERKNHYELVQFVNLGLLFGMKRSEGMKDDETLEVDAPSSIGSRAKELMRLCPLDLQERVMGQFIHRNMDELKNAQVPWFVPKHLGGVGLPPVGSFQPSNKDIRLTRKLYENQTLFPLPFSKVSAPWQTWKMATANYPKPSDLSNSEPQQGGISMNRLWSLAVVELLFKNHKISKLLTVTEATNTNFIRKRARVWRKALRDQTIPMPIISYIDRDGKEHNWRFPELRNENDVPYILDMTGYYNYKTKINLQKVVESKKSGVNTSTINIHISSNQTNTIKLT